MKPRIFVSSTFYDLKYIREDLSNFIEMHDFEPVLFENGDIGYTPGKRLDQSCYEQMASTDMVVLVIGGNYGSAASEEIEDEFNEYMSVTRKEFQTAVSERIPIFAFVDASVYAEYGVYEVNYEQIEQQEYKLAFKSTKNINVFRFIREIKGIGDISITEFKKVTDIKEFLSKQWSDMFKNYLSILRESNKDDKLIDTVGELKTLVKQMNVMLNSVGGKVFANDNDNYRNVIQLQQVISATDKIAKSLGVSGWYITDEYETRIDHISNLLNIINDVAKDKNWKNLGPTDVDGVSRFFGMFNEKGIELGSVDHSFIVYSGELELVLDNAQAKSLLLDELIKDENYKQLCGAAGSDEG